MENTNIINKPYIGLNLICYKLAVNIILWSFTFILLLPCVLMTK